MSGRRAMLLVVHTGRSEAVRTARQIAVRLSGAGVAIRVLDSEAAALACQAAVSVPVSESAAAGAEMVLVVGGDGTLLRAAELARPAAVPLLGVNLGHVGFLAETEPDVLGDAVGQIVAGGYRVERRMTVDVTARLDGKVVASTWALNEATVEKAARERMLDLVTEVDGRPLSRLGCDGVVFATPTGSTAYAFSAGGPVVWPDVEALLLVPISAHALFASPLVVSPGSVLAAEIIGAAGRRGESAGAVLWCDSRRKVDLRPGTRVEVRRGRLPVLLARLTGHPGIGATFTDRLVAKFGLPVSGWRGLGETRRQRAAAAAAASGPQPPGPRDAPAPPEQAVRPPDQAARDSAEERSGDA